MKRLIACLAVVALAAFAPGLASAQSDPAPRPTFAFTRMVMKLPDNTWGHVRAGLICMPYMTLVVGDGPFELGVDDLADDFRNEMNRQGFTVEQAETNLFEATELKSELQIAGAIKDLRVELCAPLAGLADLETIKGKASITIEWQLYSKLQRRLLAKVTTTGAFEDKKATKGNAERITDQAFFASVKAFADSPEFRTAVAGAGAPPPGTGAAAVAGPIMFHNASPPNPTLSNAVGSAVAIIDGQSFGSGVLVSSDGYILSNHHVVGAAKRVTVRWSDGFETVGEVLRTHKARDVALIKSETHGRSPLPIRPAATEVGETVFAIGTPLDQQFQSTLTRGIVSAHRIYEGFQFIQSDVAVNHGNSGGPLIDEKGNLIGLTDLGYAPDGTPTAINLFIPIGDALDFLNLKPAPKP